jgi:hypothetical protein
VIYINNLIGTITFNNNNYLGLLGNSSNSFRLALGDPSRAGLVTGGTYGDVLLNVNEWINSLNHPNID